MILAMAAIPVQARVGQLQSVMASLIRFALQGTVVVNQEPLRWELERASFSSNVTSQTSPKSVAFATAIATTTVPTVRYVTRRAGYAPRTRYAPLSLLPSKVVHR